MKSKMVLFFIFVLFACSCESMGNWDNNKTINGVKYQKVKQLPSGKYLCKINDHVFLDGVKYVKWVHLSTDYKIDAGYLGEDTIISGIPIPENTWIEYSPGYFTCSFPQTIEVNGVQISGSWFGSEGIKNSFYLNGKTRSIYVKKNMTIQNIPCKGGINTPVLFDPEGRISECTLSEAIQINNIEYKKNEKYILGIKQN